MAVNVDAAINSIQIGESLVRATVQMRGDVARESRIVAGLES
jgi:hypothetical protein